MTQARDGDGRSEDVTLHSKLREQLLLDGVNDCLPMAHVNSVAAQTCPDEPKSARHDVVLSVIRSLLDDGLMVVGDIVGASDERVEPWRLSVEDAMARIRDSYVVRHESDEWVFTIWFALTDRGQEAANRVSPQTTGS
jgi:hypothetical protein